MYVKVHRRGDMRQDSSSVPQGQQPGNMLAGSPPIMAGMAGFPRSSAGMLPQLSAGHLRTPLSEVRPRLQQQQEEQHMARHGLLGEGSATHLAQLRVASGARASWSG